MASVSVVNPKSDVLRKAVAVAANCNAAKGLADVLRTNLGPRGTLKMLVGGAGQLKVTKDGNVLLHEMQIQHPTASMIARASTAQDTITGDGTTSTVLLVGELLRQAERHIADSVHPRQLCDGIDKARAAILAVLDSMKDTQRKPGADRDLLVSVARTSLKTKLADKLAEQLTDIVVDAVLCVRHDEQPIDLFMVETIHQKQNLSTDTRLVRGMVMDHGARHPDMPRRLTNCFVLTCNVSLEYEKTEVNSGFFYSSAEQRERLVKAERRFTDEKVKKIIELKRKVCGDSKDKSFVVFNQKGIDPPSLELLAEEGIFALRRVKRRNMERLTLCCGGNAVNSVYDLTEEDLGYAGLVYEESVGDDRWTFVENVRKPRSCAVLIKGPHDHCIAQLKDALRDGLRAVKNAIEDDCVIPGAGAFEVAAYSRLMDLARSNEVKGKAKFGVQAMAEALMTIPKTLAANSGFDAQDSALALQEKYVETKEPTGLDLYTGKPVDPRIEGIWDCYRVKRQMIMLATTLAEQLLLVDEIIKAGKQMGGSK